MNTPAYYALDELGYVPFAVWKKKYDLAATGLKFVRKRRHVWAFVSAENLGGRPSRGGWVVLIIHHEKRPGPFFAWRRMKPLKSGGAVTVKVPVKVNRGMPAGAYSVRAIVVPVRARGDMTLKNNETTGTFHNR
jgi:hypothetical protein